MNYHDLSNSDAVNYKKSGFFLSAILAVIFIFLVINGRVNIQILLLSIFIAITAQAEAKLLRTIIDVFIKIGNIMHKVTNPLLFGAIFIFAVLPTSLVLKLLGKDILKIKFDKNLSTYWEKRQCNVDWHGAFKNQF